MHLHVMVVAVALMNAQMSGADGRALLCATPADVGSEEACSLNGVCADNSHDNDALTGSTVAKSAPRCLCDQGWRGARCSQLDLIAAERRTPGYRNTTMPTWYGSVVQEGNTFHMFAVARAEAVGPPFDDYFTNSKLVRLESTSDSAVGPYVLKETVLPRFAHEARAQRAPDGTVVVFGVTGTDIPMIPTTKCELLRNSSFPWNKLALSVSWAPSVHGPWQQKPLWRFHARDASSPFCRMEAPVATFAPNGSVILVFNAFPCAPTPWRPAVDQLYLATAPHWSGPYTRRDDLGPIVRRPGFAAGTEGAEDPFIWRTARGYHLLLHALGRAADENTQGAGGLAFSKDGLRWTWVNGSDSLQGAVYSPNVRWSDGTEENLTRRQAPYLHVDSGGAIQFLLNGVDTAEGQGCHWRTSWTLLQKVASHP